EPAFVGADDETAERIGEKMRPGGFTLFAPRGVGLPFGTTAVEGDETAAGRNVGGKTITGGQGTFPWIIDAETHWLITAGHDIPAIGRRPRREIAQPDENGMFGRGLGQQAPGQRDFAR